MALYDQLPVFRDAYALLRIVYLTCNTMERTYRFTLGERLQKEMTDIFLNVYRANNVTDKTTHIEHARENVEIVRLLFRLAYDEKQFSTKQYVETNEKIESISKQLAAWKKSTRSFR